MSRQLMIGAADKQLYAVQTPGGAPPRLVLSGGFGTVQYSDHVIRRLAQKYRAVRFDARARGKSGTSADYSVRAAVDDIGRVIDAPDIKRPILVRPVVGTMFHRTTSAGRWQAGRPPWSWPPRPHRPAPTTGASRFRLLMASATTTALSRW
jgi:hypothetical protein